ncbi:MAG: TIGR02757 family protein [Deltaproteobacteria bacterium]|nr:TIGR02757 family protein [Deltaproteobacteria bacterium]
MRDAHAGFDAQAALKTDPLRFARRYAGPDREVVAVLSALLAFGRVKTIGDKLTTLFKLLGPSPADTVRGSTRRALTARLRGFRHRTFRGEDLAGLAYALGALLTRDGSVFTSLGRAWADTRDLREALARWVSELRALSWPEGMTRATRHLLPDPKGPSASKRLLLLLRWVCRPDDGVDLGLTGAVPTSALRVPVDVHVHRVARNLGLTARPGATWETAGEITDALRALDPEDPTRFDMALCHLGIQGQCPSRRDPVRCEGCAFRGVCVHWRGRKVEAPGRG